MKYLVLTVMLAMSLAFNFKQHSNSTMFIQQLEYAKQEKVDNDKLYRKQLDDLSNVDIATRFDRVFSKNVGTDTTVGTSEACNRLMREDPCRFFSGIIYGDDERSISRQESQGVL